MSAIELIEEFHETVVKVKYPDVTFEQTEKICRAPFEFLKKAMSNMVFPRIRFMHLGLFAVTPKKARSALKSLEKQLESGNMTQEKYDKWKPALTTLVRRYEKQGKYKSTKYISVDSGESQV